VRTHRYVQVLGTQSIGQKDKFIVAVLAGNEYVIKRTITPKGGLCKYPVKGVSPCM